jgi:acyl-coenzyme A synthetase/AMP-(fatty) acid ligase
MAREPGLTADDVLVAVTTLSFDIAVLELQLPLTLGAMVVIATRDEAMDGPALSGLLERHRATVMQATPITWRVLLEAGWTRGGPFKALVGGEAMPKDLADQLIAREVELWNMYGPTETTVWSACARISDTSKGIAIGKPIANTTVWILDAHKNLCPIGVPGELCIGGEGVALGYWNRPELTADRFIPDPFSATPGATLYRTGDRARWRNDGTLEHLGRLDDQVKVRGFRIELGEIEAGIARYPAVREVVVVLREDAPGDKRLVAYLVAENPPADLVDQLRALIRATMPEYMVPAHFVSMDALPRTHNGKLDRKALPAPSVEGVAPRAAAVAPRTATEEMVMGVFSGVLERVDFGVLDSFFDLGGHSLTAARIMARLRAASNRDLPLRVLFERQTVSGLAEAIDALAWLESSGQPRAAGGNRVEIEL